MRVEHKRLKRLFDSLGFQTCQGLLLGAYHGSGPGRPFYHPMAVIKALMLQRFGRIPSERALAEGHGFLYGAGQDKDSRSLSPQCVYTLGRVVIDMLCDY